MAIGGSAMLCASGSTLFTMRLLVFRLAQWLEALLGD